LRRRATSPTSPRSRWVTRPAAPSPGLEPLTGGAPLLRRPRGLVAAQPAILPILR
jgi:hypothetical protein